MIIAGFSWRGRGPRPPAETPGAFTEHVRLLATAKGPLDASRFEPLWTDLRKALRNELKQRGLWESPPNYLGIYGGKSWTEPGGGTSDAFEELLIECYSYIFLQRLRSLRAQLEVKPNVDGLVFLNIQHFVYERQKEHDPVGSQVFEVLQSALRAALAAGDLHRVAGDERVRNDTVLSFAGTADIAGTDVPAPPPGLIAARVARWNDDLLPDLVTLRGQRQEEVVGRLRKRLPELQEDGVEAFRFKDLIDPLKADVRARWAAILDQSQGETVPQAGEDERKEQVRTAQPDLGVEDRQLFRRLVDCVLTSVRRIEISEKTRGYLNTLWQFVRVQASEGEALEPPDARLDQRLREAAEEERLSQRKIAELLRIPRERLPELYEILGDLLQRCRAAHSGRAAALS